MVDYILARPEIFVPTSKNLLARSFIVDTNEIASGTEQARM